MPRPEPLATSGPAGGPAASRSLLRVALGQLEADSAGVDSVVDAVERAGPVDLVVLPELALTGYIRRSDTEVVTVTADGPEVAAVARAARRTGATVVVGASLAGQPPTNEVLVITGGGAVERTAKTHLWGRESDLYRAGDVIAPIPAGGLQLGAMVCFDVEFPEVARTLALQGADLLVTVAANMDPYGPDHAVALRGRALENRLPHVYVNATGPRGSLDFVGESGVADADGSVLASMAATPGIVVVEVPLGRPPEAEDIRADYLARRRPDLYRPDPT